MPSYAFVKQVCFFKLALHMSGFQRFFLNVLLRYPLTDICFCIPLVWFNANALWVVKSEFSYYYALCCCFEKI